MTQRLTSSDSGVRLDKRLTQQLSYSRNFFGHIIERGGVQRVDPGSGNLITLKKSYKIKTGDQIVIENLERFLDGGLLEEAKWIDLPIREETDDYLIIYKPKGVLSHPNSIWDVETPSVVARAYHHYKEQLPSMGNFIRAGLIHRLDRETDGLMVLAKTEAGLKHFKTLFEQKSTARTLEAKEAAPLRKFYRARCDILPEGQQLIDDIRSRLPYTIIEDVIPRVPHPVIREGITRIHGLEILADGSAQLDIEIMTGRTHQIRYHLSHHGLPIQGDYLYHPAHDDSSAPPLQLTSYRLDYQDMDGQLQSLVLDKF